ncbi:metallophosphoesterase [Planctomycetaceae bacterium SCGC AG-212-F19]|nr:metallophosphoesterase [Planctomycetaceae bacterium SCGC AG-212-F19]
MGNEKQTVSQPSPADDGIDRRGMLKCMAWVGTGMIWGVAGGIATSRTFGQQAPAAKATLNFVQISDSHLGFARDPNKDVAATLRQTIARINALPEPPAFVLHTGDLTHLAKTEEFDAVAELLKEVKTGKVFCVPGEHDFDGAGNKEYLKRYGQGTNGTGWHSFDHRGVHFIGLANVANAKSGSGDGGLGVIGQDQLQWLAKDVAGLKDSTPIVVFAHVPLWSVYEKWGWGTRDAEQALAILKRFGSLTVLNGHIHQVLQKVEGKVTFHTARSTAFPQSEPGKGTPGPIRDLPAARLKAALGLSTVAYVENRGALAIVDSTIE